MAARAQLEGLSINAADVIRLALDRLQEQLSEQELRDALVGHVLKEAKDYPGAPSAGSPESRTSPHQVGCWDGPQAALALGASFSHHARVEGSGRTVPGMPDPSRKRPQPTRHPSQPMACSLIEAGGLRWLCRLPLVLSRHATVSTIPRGSRAGQTAGPGNRRGHTMTEAAVSSSAT